MNKGEGSVHFNFEPEKKKGIKLVSKVDVGESINMVNVPNSLVSKIQ